MRGDGRVYQRVGHWWVYWRQSGQARRESVAAALGISPVEVTPQDAQDLLRYRLTQARASGVVAAPDQRLTVADLMPLYEASLRAANKKVATVQGKNDAVVRWLGHHRITRLTLGLLEQEVIRAGRAFGWKPGTIKTRLYMLRAALAWAKRTGRLGVVPDLPKIRVRRETRQNLTATEIGQLVTHLAPCYADVARFGFLTGWRVTEITGLTWAEVNRTLGVIDLGDNKIGGLTRPYREDPWLDALIEQRWKARHIGCPYVFHRDGRGISADTFREHWHEARTRAKLPYAIPHDFRSIAYEHLLVEAGLDLPTAMTLVGHKTMSTALGYNRVGLARQRAGLAQLAARRTSVVP